MDMLFISRWSKWVMEDLYEVAVYDAPLGYADIPKYSEEVHAISEEEAIASAMKSLTGVFYAYYDKSGGEWWIEDEFGECQVYPVARVIKPAELMVRIGAPMLPGMVAC